MQSRHNVHPLPVDPAINNERLLNRAFRCFAFVGLATLPVGIGGLLAAFRWMSFDEGTNGGTLSMLFGMILAGPLALCILAATAYGLRQTVRLRHRALIVLSAITVVCGGGLIILLPYTPGWEGRPDSPNIPIVDYSMITAFAIFLVANISIPAWWFTKGRRLHRKSALGHE